MKIDDVIHDFAVAGDTLPRASMRSALDNWDAAGPRFIALLERYAQGVDRTAATANALFFVVHLLAEKRESKAFPALCRLVQDREASESVLGEAITECLAGIIIATYNGDPSALKGVIESPTADEFERAAALDAMAYLTRTGVFADPEMRVYLLHLLAEMQPQSASFVWTAWALGVANLGYRDYAVEVEQLMRRGFVADGDMNLKDFDQQLRRTLADPEGMAGFEHDRIGPLADAIGTLAAWDGFSEERKADRVRAGAAPEETSRWLGPVEPFINPHRQVGRNDPCPCGSGKKYKRCCLQ